jgi:hypothetical protein
VRLLGDGFYWQLGERRGDTNDLSSCVTEEVDRVLDSARTIKRARINGYAQLLGQRVRR